MSDELMTPREAEIAREHSEPGNLVPNDPIFALTPFRNAQPARARRWRDREGNPLPVDPEAVSAVLKRLELLPDGQRYRQETFECKCQNTGWVWVEFAGAGTVARCELCGGPDAWCRHRIRRGKCAPCEAERAEHRKTRKRGEVF